MTAYACESHNKGEVARTGAVSEAGHLVSVQRAI